MRSVIAAVGISVVAMLAGCSGTKPAAPAAPSSAAAPAADPNAAATPSAPPTRPEAPVTPSTPEPPSASPSDHEVPSWYTQAPVRSGSRVQVAAMAAGATVSEARDAAVAAGRESLRRALGHEPSNPETLRVQVVPHGSGYRAYVLSAGE